MKAFQIRPISIRVVTQSAILLCSMACGNVDDSEVSTALASDALKFENSQDKLAANPTPPNLKELRQAARHTKAAARSAKSAVAPIEIPGGLGAGVSFNSGALQANESATLYTHMVVYSEGFGFDLPADFFTTSTNRTEKGVEVVGWYREQNIHHIGVFDWSCSVDDPCSGGQTSPSWIWTRPFNDEPCHLTEGPDGNGRIHESMYYANATVQSEGEWLNEVRFWNYCISDWDVVYSHSYGGTQQDCSVTGCGWWGPIIENFHDLDAGYPIPELGFFDTTLVHNGTTSNLSPAETSFNGPPSTWHLCYIEPNHSWSTTPLACAADTALSASLTVISNWDAGYCAEIRVANGGTTAVSTWAVDLAMNASTLGNTWNGGYTATTAGHYDVAPLSWNGAIPAGGSVTTGFCGAKTGTGWTPVVSID